MSEQEKPKSFMAELDQWIEDKVFEPLQEGFFLAMDGDMSLTSTEAVKKAIREKVLQSYHNGLAMGQKRASQPQKGGQYGR